eukprot:SAG31_NODE_14681_length_793_cov_0.933718_2_plen_160_part_00
MCKLTTRVVRHSWQAWRQIESSRELEEFLAGSLRLSAVSLRQIHEAQSEGTRRRAQVRRNLRGGSGGSAGSGQVHGMVGAGIRTGQTLGSTSAASEFHALTQFRIRQIRANAVPCSSKFFLQLCLCAGRHQLSVKIAHFDVETKHFLLLISQIRCRSTL